MAIGTAWQELLKNKGIKMALFDRFVEFFSESQRITVSDFELPKFVAKINQKLPDYPHALILCTALNYAKKRGILPEDDLEFLQGKSFCVAMIDGGTSAFFTYDSAQQKFKPIAQQTADVYFKAKLSGFLQLLLRQEDPDTLFFKRHLQLEGDTELGLFIKNMLDAVEIPKIVPPGFSH